jgi:hypothetical protein
MNLLKKKYIHLLTIGLIAIFFISLLLSALLIGGRWDLNEQIAFGDRLSDGFAGYANGITDLFFPTSPYFPGVGYLSYFYQLIGVDDIYVNNQFMLLTAVLAGLLYFILLRKLTLRLYPGISKVAVTIMLIVLYATHFRVYMNYMVEFKPDTILLVIATISFLLLENGKKPTISNLIITGAFLFLSTLFKQSFFILFLFVFQLVFFNRFFSFKEKAVVILSYGIFGILALYLIINVPNLYYYSVDVMGYHPMLDAQTIVGFFISGIKSNIIFIAAFLFFLIKRFKFSITTFESRYFLFAAMWFMFSAISTAKVGGNVGNFEVSIIVFMPFVIYTIDSLLKRFYSAKVFPRITYVVLFLGILSYSYLSLSYGKGLIGKIKADKAAIEFLSDNFKNKYAFIDGNTYIVAEMANMEVLTELETLAHFNNVPGYDFARLKNAIRLKKYDIFFLSQPKYDSFSLFADKNVRKEIEENYVIYENINMPEQLKDRILVPKKDK